MNDNGFGNGSMEKRPATDHTQLEFDMLLDTAERFAVAISREEFLKQEVISNCVLII
jgi:hypothetical protein